MAAGDGRISQVGLEVLGDLSQPTISQVGLEVLHSTSPPTPNQYSKTLTIRARIYIEAGDPTENELTIRARIENPTAWISQVGTEVLGDFTQTWISQVGLETLCQDPLLSEQELLIRARILALTEQNLQIRAQIYIEASEQSQNFTCRARIVGRHLRVVLPVSFNVVRDQRIRLRVIYQFSQFIKREQEFTARARITRGYRIPLHVFFNVKAPATSGSVQTFDYNSFTRTTRICFIKARIVR